MYIDGSAFCIGVVTGVVPLDLELVPGRKITFRI